MDSLPFFAQTKQTVEAFLTDLFERRITDAKHISDGYEALWQEIAAVSSRGKRLRPYLTMVGYGSFSATIVPVAAAQELVHTAMLVHDDIIDEDTVRHGTKNISGHYTDTYAPWLADTSLRHFADSAALLAGDALLSEAYAVIAETGLSTAHIRALHTRLHRSIFEVIGGELLDVEAAFVGDMLPDPLAIYRYKTASYSFIGPLVSGAICADAPHDTIERLTTFGLNAGIAFQLQDDLLGLFGDEVITGKSTLSDLREAKATYLISAHKQRMNADMAARFSAHFGANATDQEYHALKRDIEDSGARATTEKLVEEYYQKATAALDGLLQADDLRTFTNIILQRAE